MGHPRAILKRPTVGEVKIPDSCKGWVTGTLAVRCRLRLRLRLRLWMMMMIMIIVGTIVLRTIMYD